MQDNKTMTAPTITCNGNSRKMNVGIFGKASSKKGQSFFTPDFSEDAAKGKTEEEKLELAKPALYFCGIDFVLSSLTRTARRVFASLVSDETIVGPDGKIDWDTWKEAAEKWTETQEGLKDLEDQIQSKQDALQSYVDEQAKFYDSGDGDNPEVEAIRLKMVALSEELRPLKAKHKEITLKYEARNAIRAANKLKADAAAKVAAEAAAANAAAKTAGMTAGEIARAEVS